MSGFVVTDLEVCLPRRRDFRSLFDISRYTMFFGPTNSLYFWFDTFMIGLLLTRADVSAYEIAWQTTRILILPTTAIRQTIFPKVSRWASDDEFEEIKRVLPGAILFMLTIPLPGLVGLAILAPDILRFVYKPEYVVAALPLAILAGYMVIESLHRIGSAVLTGMDRPDVPFRSRLVGIVLVVVLNVALIPRFGLVGAAVATILAKIADAAVLWYGLGNLVSVQLPVRSLLWQGASALLMGTAVVGIVHLGVVTSLPSLLVVAGGGAAIYGGLIVLDRDIRQVLQQYVPVL